MQYSGLVSRPLCVRLRLFSQSEKLLAQSALRNTLTKSTLNANTLSDCATKSFLCPLMGCSQLKCNKKNSALFTEALMNNEGFIWYFQGKVQKGRFFQLC